MLVGDLNTTLTEPDNNRRGTEITTELTEEGLEDMDVHFFYAPTQMGQGTKDVEHGKGGGGSSVPDGLHPGYMPPSLLERVCLGSMAQH